jgi:hypothetical protein
MPNLVTQYPSTLGFIWGCPTPETGFAVESIDENTTCDVYEQKDNVGEVIEVVTYNPRSEITVNGEVTAAYAGVVGQKTTIANLSLIGYAPTTVAGLVVIKSVRITENRTSNQRISLTATMYPLIPAAG